jgi:tetratricopeptide (TPR) repeat protein
MRRRIIILFLLSLITIYVGAQRLTVNAPSHVAVGETFRLEYTVNTVNVNGNLHIGNIPEPLEVVYGPSVSRQESYSMVNGHTSGSSSMTFTYMLMADKNGTFTIAPAHINIGGRTISSARVRISVSGSPMRNTGGKTKFHQDTEDQAEVQSAGSHITGKDLFIRVTANKTVVHEQEPVLLTYKVYTLVDLTQLEGKMPDLNGFHTQEVTLPQQKTYHDEVINGRHYKCVTWSQYVMYPQMTGKLQIPSITFKGIVVQENRNVNPYEAFFNGGSGYIEVKRDIVAPGVTIKVNPLPARPSNFSGGVGKFNISAQLDKAEIKAGYPIDLRVVVSGIGNLKLIKQPTVVFPKDFDKYDAKITDKTKLTANGVEGNMLYDYMAVPRNKGKYTIPAIEFTYYDTESNAYKTIKTKAFIINVTPGDGKGPADDFSAEDHDIRPIKLGLSANHPANVYLFGSARYLIMLFIPFLIFIILLILFRKRAINNANVSRKRNKKASKAATKRLKQANLLMLKGKRNEFYDEVLKALWGYAGDKLNMDAEQLSKDKLKEEFKSKGVCDSVIDKFIQTLDDSEFERFAPGGVEGNMNRIFESAMMDIMAIDDEMKTKTNKNKIGKMALVLFFIMLMPLSSFAITKENADAEYKKGNYQQAINDYEDILKTSVSPELYYNLGNAYYRTDNITHAVLNYERALMLSPGDNDIRSNLQLARSKTIDKIEPTSEMFFITWYHSIVNMKSSDSWAIMAIAFFILVAVLILIYIFADRILIRKIGFFGGILFFVLFVLCNVFAYQQKQQLINRTGAIVTSFSVSVKKTPEQKGNTVFIIHEGTKVDILDNSIKDWKEIKLADGREGWILSNQIEKI